MSEHKYKSWMVTVLSNKKEVREKWLPSEEELYVCLLELGDKFVFQHELNENSLEEGTSHFQCCIQTNIRTRKSTLLSRLSKTLQHPVERIRVEKIEGTWSQAVEYCSKEESRLGLAVFSPAQGRQYDQSDISFLSRKENRYPWQNRILDEIFTKVPTAFKTPDDRKILWITDKQGCSGKSKLVKYLCSFNCDCVKISFGSANQIRSAVVATGARTLYLFDIPRTLGSDDSMSSILSVIEDVKNGFVVSSFYGKHNQLLMQPPHIIVFSNMKCPVDALSIDRWEIYYIQDKYLTKTLDKYYPSEYALKEGLI